jgi:hypothetical protein
LIEIGREPSRTWVTRRISATFGGMSALVLLVWLIRGPLLIQKYSLDLLLVSFGFVLLSRVFDTKTNAGVGRAISSFLGNLTATSVIVVVMIAFLSGVAYLQGGDSVFTKDFYPVIPDLVIAALVTGLGAYAARKLSPQGSGLTPSGPLFLVKAGSENAVGGVGLTVKRDTVGIPIKRSGRTVGCILNGDLSASIETPMGRVNSTLSGPVTTFWVRFKGERIGDAEVSRLTGKTPKQLLQDARVDTTMSGSGQVLVDLPFVHVQQDGFGESVDVGPVNVQRDPYGGRVKIGPFDFETDGDHVWDDHHWRRWERKQAWRERHGWRGGWAARGTGDSYVQSDGWRTTAKWNGSRLELDGSSMKLSVGSDGFSYSPTEIRTSSPLHTLQVNQDKITLDTRKFTLKVSGNTVVLRAEEKTTSTESKALAGDLRVLLTEAAKKQVKDVLEGLPIDLSEMLTNTEEVLARHG